MIITSNKFSLISVTVNCYSTSLCVTNWKTLSLIYDERITWYICFFSNPGKYLHDRRSTKSVRTKWRKCCLCCWLELIEYWNMSVEIWPKLRARYFNKKNKMQKNEVKEVSCTHQLEWNWLQLTSTLGTCTCLLYCLWFFSACELSLLVYELSTVFIHGRLCRKIWGI